MKKVEAISLIAALLLVPLPAEAVRFAVGLAAGVTPLVLEDADTGGVRLDLRPVLDVEVLPWLAFDAYAPFTVLRTGPSGRGSSTGAESVFAVGASGRWRSVESGREWFYYGTFRGGFATVDGSAGPYTALVAGAALTWLDTGRGVFAELGAGRIAIAGAGESGADLERWLGQVALGAVFRLGGETWDL